MQALSWHTTKYLVYTLKARVYTEKIQKTRGLLGSVGTDHVQGQISVQIQMEAIVFIFLQIFSVARGMFSKLGNHSVIPQFSLGDFIDM